MAKKRGTSTQRARTASRTERALKSSSTKQRGSEPPKRPPGEGKIEDGPFTATVTTL